MRRAEMQRAEMQRAELRRTVSSRPMRERRAYWIGGTFTALSGVALARLLAPEFEGGTASLVLVAGFVLVTIGLTILACATRRKKSETFLIVDKDAPEQDQA